MEIMDIRGLAEYVKENAPKMSEYYDSITFQMEEDGYLIMLEKNPRFGYILGLPGSTSFHAVIMESIASLPAEEIAEIFAGYFSSCAEMNDETYDEGKIFVSLGMESLA